MQESAALVQLGERGYCSVELRRAVKGESTQDIDILNQVKIFLPFVSTFKEGKVKLQFLWNIWLLKISYFTCYF